MTWLRLDDKLWDHPKFAACGSPAKLLFIGALLHAAEYSTNGRFSELVAHQRGGYHWRKALADLETHGLIHRNGNGWILHDFLDYNPSQAQLEVERAKTRERVARHRARNGDVTPLQEEM